MQRDIFIGIDGGATKTEARIEDSIGNVIGIGIGGPSNIRFSVPKAWESIYQSIHNALSGSKIRLDSSGYDFHIGLGLAGTGIKQAKDDFLNTPHKFKTLVLESDAHVACLGSHNGKNGAILNIGTGIIGYQICNGKINRISGWGFPHADTGSGAWLGMEAVRLTFSWLDNCVKPSNLLKRIFATCNNDLSELVKWANSSSATQFASIATIVLEEFEKKDPYAIELMKKSISEISSLILGLANRCPKPDNPLPCHLLGGLSSFVFPHIRYKHVSLAGSKDVATRGAIYLVKEKLGYDKE